MSDEMTDDTNKAATEAVAEKAPEILEPNAAVSGSGLPQAELNRLTDDIIAGLKTVYDPEIPADIYELGLIYKIDIARRPFGQSRYVADLAQLPGGAGTADQCGKCRRQRRRRQGSQGDRGLGPAVGPEPDVGRGAFSLEYVVTLIRRKERLD